MELDALPDQDGSGQSDGGFVWAPSVHSEASGPTPPPSTLLAAPPSPTWPPPPPPASTPASSPSALAPTVLAALEEEPFPWEHHNGSSPPPGQDIRDQAFMDQFKMLADMDNGEDILAGLEPTAHGC